MKITFEGTKLELRKVLLSVLEEDPRGIQQDGEKVVEIIEGLNVFSGFVATTKILSRLSKNNNISLTPKAFCSLMNPLIQSGKLIGLTQKRQAGFRGYEIIQPVKLESGS